MQATPSIYTSRTVSPAHAKVTAFAFCPEGMTSPTYAILALFNVSIDGK
jgi:hypothetical protein